MNTQIILFISMLVISSNVSFSDSKKFPDVDENKFWSAVTLCREARRLKKEDTARAKELLAELNEVPVSRTSPVWPVTESFRLILEKAIGETSSDAHNRRILSLLEHRSVAGEANSLWILKSAGAREMVGNIDSFLFPLFGWGFRLEKGFLLMDEKVPSKKDIPRFHAMIDPPPPNVPNGTVVRRRIGKIPALWKDAGFHMQAYEAVVESVMVKGTRGFPQAQSTKGLLWRYNWHIGMHNVWYRVAELAYKAGVPDEALEYLAKGAVVDTDGTLKKAKQKLRQWQKAKTLPVDSVEYTEEQKRKAVLSVAQIYASMNAHPGAWGVLKEHKALFDDPKVVEEKIKAYQKQWIDILNQRKMTGLIDITFQYWVSHKQDPLRVKLHRSLSKPLRDRAILQAKNVISMDVADSDAKVKKPKCTNPGILYEPIFNRELQVPPKATRTFPLAVSTVYVVPKSWCTTTIELEGYWDTLLSQKYKVTITNHANEAARIAEVLEGINSLELEAIQYLNVAKLYDACGQGVSEWQWFMKIAPVAKKYKFHIALSKLYFYYQPGGPEAVAFSKKLLASKELSSKKMALGDVLLRYAVTANLYSLTSYKAKEKKEYRKQKEQLETELNTLLRTRIQHGIGFFKDPRRRGRLTDNQREYLLSLLVSVQNQRLQQCKEGLVRECSSRGDLVRMINEPSISYKQLGERLLKNALDSRNNGHICGYLNDLTITLAPFNGQGPADLPLLKRASLYCMDSGDARLVNRAACLALMYPSLVNETQKQFLYNHVRKHALSGTSSPYLFLQYAKPSDLSVVRKLYDNWLKKRNPERLYTQSQPHVPYFRALLRLGDKQARRMLTETMAQKEDIGKRLWAGEMVTRCKINDDLMDGIVYMLSDERMIPDLIAQGPLRDKDGKIVPYAHTQFYTRVCDQALRMVIRLVPSEEEWAKSISPYYGSRFSWNDKMVPIKPYVLRRMNSQGWVLLRREAGYSKELYSHVRAHLLKRGEKTQSK